MVCILYHPSYFPLSELRKNIWECLRPSVWECNWGLFSNLSASNFSHETPIKPCAKTLTACSTSTCWLLICPVVYQRMCAWGIHSLWTSEADRCFTAATVEFQRLWQKNLFRSQANGIAAFSSDLLSLKFTPRDSHLALQESHCFLPWEIWIDLSSWPSSWLFSKPIVVCFIFNVSLCQSELQFGLEVMLLKKKSVFDLEINEIFH